MWLIFESDKLDRAARWLPREVLVRYEKWKDVIRLSGLEGLRAIKGFHDEKLGGRWRGYRSSRLGDKYRVIYSVNKDRFYVKVITITPHDYRRS
jgi:mRNA-degrading endonuclease RelE of RelBE toxin-antitoxin system